MREKEEETDGEEDETRCSISFAPDSAKQVGAVLLKLLTGA